MTRFFTDDGESVPVTVVDVSNNRVTQVKTQENDGFSAPVRLQYAETPAQLLHRLAHDSDPFNRWEAGQTLLLQAATRHASASANPGEPALNGAQMEAMRAVLRHPQLDAAFKALALTLPAEKRHCQTHGQPGPTC